MGVYKYKLRRGAEGDWYAWDGDLGHLPFGPLSAGVGADLTTIVGTSTTTLSATGFDNLVTVIKAQQVSNLVTPFETAAGSTEAVADVQALLDEITFTTA